MEIKNTGESEIDYYQTLEKKAEHIVVDKNKCKSVDIRNCMVLPLHCVKFLSYRTGDKQIDFIRAAVEDGNKFLWKMANESIDIFRQAFQIAHQSGNPTDWIEKASFDLGSNEFKRFNGNIPEEDYSQIWKFADDVGLPFSTIFQLCLLAGLLKSEQITKRDNHKIYKILMRFHKWLITRAMHVSHYMDMICRLESEKHVVVTGERKNLDDILKLENKTN